MLDAITIFMLYAVQGAVQGLVFVTLPLLLRRNPAATNVHQSLLSMVVYPFSFKFIFAPLVDGMYSSWLGRRESWLLPLQLICSLLLGGLAGSINDLMDASPPQVGQLVAMLFVIVSATAVGGIATDAWANSRMSDSRASVCQAVGLTVGFGSSVTVFFLLKGRGLVDIQTMLIVMSTSGFLVLGTFFFRSGKGSPESEADDEDAVGVMTVVVRVWQLVQNVRNIRWWLAFSALAPVLGGHQSVLSVRYQAAGFSPELFADYDLCLVPLGLTVMALGGRISQTPRLLTFLSWISILKVLLDVAFLYHYRLVLSMGDGAVHDATLKVTYICLSQLADKLGLVLFIIRASFINRIAKQHEAIGGTVITFMACCGNFGGSLPATWTPLVADVVGLEITAGICTCLGLLVLAIFWKRLRTLEDPTHAGWMVDTSK